jgi:hypothetical protein
MLNSIIDVDTPVLLLVAALELESDECSAVLVSISDETLEIALENVVLLLAVTVLCVLDTLCDGIVLKLAYSVLLIPGTVYELSVIGVVDIDISDVPETVADAVGTGVLPLEPLRECSPETLASGVVAVPTEVEL